MTRADFHQVHQEAGLWLIGLALLSWFLAAAPTTARADDAQPGQPTTQPAEVRVKDGDRIVFLGDSITAGASGKEGFITLITADLAKKYPDGKFETINAGISGNKVPDLLGRLQKDVIARKPTIVFIYIGVNDVWHWKLPGNKGTPKDQYDQGLRKLIHDIREAGSQVILCTPAAIGEKKDGENPQDKMLNEYCDVSRSVAKEEGVPLVDLREALLAYDKEHNPDDKDRGILTADGVHLTTKGNRLVAEQMEKALGMMGEK